MILKYFVRDAFNSEPQCAIEGIDGERRARLFLWAAVVLHVLGGSKMRSGMPCTRKNSLER